MFIHITLAFFLNSKTQKLPPKTSQNQKSNMECSSELMFKTKNVKTHQIRKSNVSKNSKTQKLPPKPPKTKNQLCMLQLHNVHKLINVIRRPQMNKSQKYKVLAHKKYI